MTLLTAESSVPALIHGEAYSFMTPVQFNLAEMQAAIEQGKQAYNEQRYTDAIRRYTTVLRTLYDDVLPTIHLSCAGAYEMQHQYDLALSESQHASNHPDSYFSQASAYYFKREYPEAIDAYKRGITAVSPTTHPQQHMMLVQKHQQIVDELNKRNQRLQHMLPYEVLSRILSLLCIKDRVRLASTCRFWHKFLLHDWPDMWSHIDATKDLGMSTRLISGCLSKALPAKLRSVVLEFPDGDSPRSRPSIDPDLNEAIDDDNDDDDRMPPPPPPMLFPTTNAAQNRPAVPYSISGMLVPSHHVAASILMYRRELRIESLEIAGYSENRLCELLNSCKHSLKRLKLTDCNDLAYEKYVLIDVAQICPNLQSLTIVERDQQVYSINDDDHNHTNAAANRPTPPLPSPTIDHIMLPQLPNLSLTRLDLSLWVPESLLVDILKKCPNLVCLELSFRGNGLLAPVLGATHTYCAQLQSLRYGPRFSTENTGFHFDQQQQQQYHPTTTITTTGNRGRRLYEISVNMWHGSSGLKPRQRKELFDRFNALHHHHRNTLQVLRFIGCSGPTDDYYDITLLAQHGAPYLRSLQLKTYSNDSQLLSRAIRACPLLEQVDILCSHSNLVDDCVLETLGLLTKLSRLSIDIHAQEQWPETQLTSKGLTRLFFSNNSRLSDLTFHFNYETANSYMKHQFVTDLARIISRSSFPIRKLDIQGIWLSHDMLITFFTHLQVSQIRQLAITLHRDRDSTPSSRPDSHLLDQREIRALGIIKRLNYLKINDPEKLVSSNNLKQILKMAAEHNKQPFLLIHVENSEGKMRSFEGYLERAPITAATATANAVIGDNNSGLQQQQQPIIRVRGPAPNTPTGGFTFTQQQQQASL
ncbi:hypothetical protein BDB00DRAFT_871972 [Zychaea mexicana]|uniref:uncharacterized protein n=1 Tax=Zychaea mexicana TaxID=64656 RepID=UPI0022FDDF79|nr:uncharacterized protein BDB00DRAFT_871972 [Zychaea mexicana]KAI9493969.1 hypothetical protein BDB00DRAFT_871972 [Zychaea mexicana]